ncbi:MAG: DNA methylase [Candidatus Stahlbacteria bacterium]|nr:DNA methylase [Candidatus Stahlbacteria bacterium]
MNTNKLKKGSFNKNILTQEQLNIHTYPEQEKIPSVLEVPKSTNSKLSKFNDIDLNRWKEYEEIITDSLWLLGKRDNSGVHTGELHGNFIPQIPHQAMLRYTKQGEIVLDTFLGSGTTLIECKRIGRNGIGIELLPDLVKRAKELIAQESNLHNVKTSVIEGDNTENKTIENVKKTLNENYNSDTVQLIIMHPPYHDIIKFSDNPNDLCNTKTTDEFLNKFSQVVKNTYPLLDEKRFLVLVIGDKYSQSEWVPLSFYTMQKVLENGYKLKSIVIKNISGNRAKRNAEQLWRRRALSGGFYIFKHEYILFFQKR